MYFYAQSVLFSTWEIFYKSGNTANFPTETEDKNDVKVIIKKFDDYLESQKNVTFERHIFISRVQAPGESIDQFVTDLKTKAKSCEYGQLCDSLIKDKIVVGIHDNALRARLLRETDLDSQEAIQMCRAAEAFSNSSCIRHRSSHSKTDANKTRSTSHWSRHVTSHHTKLWVLWKGSQQR